MSKKDTKLVSKETAVKDVISISRRLASLYFHFTLVLSEELGEEKAKEITKKVIKKYGEESGREAREKVQRIGLSLEKENFSRGSDLPSVGWESEPIEYPDGKRNVKITYCPFAEYWIEKGAEELGRLYCYVDQAKYSGFNPELQCIHVKNVLDGDQYCEIAVEITACGFSK